MTRACLDANEVRLRANIRRLERSDIFEAVSRHHPVVGVSSGGENCGIGLTGLNVVIRRIVEEVTEIHFVC